MIKTSTIAQACIVAIARPVLSSLDIGFGFLKLITSSKEIYQLGEYSIFVWIFI
jgi:hypothetical protein